MATHCLSIPRPIPIQAARFAHNPNSPLLFSNLLLRVKSIRYNLQTRTSALASIEHAVTHLEKLAQEPWTLRMKFGESIVNQTDVSLLLAKHVMNSTEGKDKNLVFSPLSIHVLLGMIAAGSSGPTRDQMLDFLKSKSTAELNTVLSQLITTLLADGSSFGAPHLSVANGVWIDQSMRFKPTFKEIVDYIYKAVSKHVDFQTKTDDVIEEVNMWADKETNGLIKDILALGSVNALTRLILANALYFKGTWNQKFDASETKDDDFFLLNDTSIRVPFMTSKKKQYVRAYDGFKVLELPYKQGEDECEFSMCFFLPDAKDGLPALIEKISSESGFIDNHFPNHKVKVGDFRIPKFKIEFGFEASEVLKGLGLVLPFYGGGLMEMVDSTDGTDLFVSKILHKSLIEVNEEGTEAAAVTAAIEIVGCAPGKIFEDKIDFVADHPFVFVLRERMTGVVLFIGQVFEPRCGMA